MVDAIALLADARLSRLSLRNPSMTASSIAILSSIALNSGKRSTWLMRRDFRGCAGGAVAEPSKRPVPAGLLGGYVSAECSGACSAWPAGYATTRSATSKELGLHGAAAFVAIPQRDVSFPNPVVRRRDRGLLTLHRDARVDRENRANSDESYSGDHARQSIERQRSRDCLLSIPDLLAGELEHGSGSLIRTVVAVQSASHSPRAEPKHRRRMWTAPAHSGESAFPCAAADSVLVSRPFATFACVSWSWCTIAALWPSALAWSACAGCAAPMNSRSSAGMKRCSLARAMTVRM